MFVTDSEMRGLIPRKTFSGAESTRDFIYYEVFKCQPKCKINAIKEEATLFSGEKKKKKAWTWGLRNQMYWFFLFHHYLCGLTQVA